MRARLMVLAAMALLLVLPMQPGFAAMKDVNPSTNLDEVDLPAALDQDMFFDELPFAQQRQVLREEIDNGQLKGLSPLEPRQYNLLIR